MAALTNVRDTSELGGKYIALPVKGATTIYQGAIVAVDANGYAIPGKKAADLKAAGRAEETVENKGEDGDAVIRVSRGTFVFENSTSGKITAAEVLGPCYIEDDQTVTKTATSASVVGYASQTPVMPQTKDRSRAMGTMIANPRATDIA